MRGLLAVGLLALRAPAGVGAAEVDRPQIAAWYEQAGNLLDQGLYATARDEYGRVLEALPPQQRAGVLQKVARCYYLEGRLDDAVTTLQRALLLAPRSDVTRQLLAGTMDNLQRGEEARRWSRRLDEEGPAALAEELAEHLPPDELAFHRAQGALPRPDLPTAHRIGSFRIAFEERSPASSVDLYRERYQTSRQEMAVMDPAEGEYDPAAESWEVFVPENYDRQAPFGLLVWISPADSGGLARPDNLVVLGRKRLIWIGANNSGNDRWQWYRTTLALDAAYNMDRYYHLDPDRIYVAGYSGGGRVASSLALLYPEVFRGGAFFFGVDYFRPVPVAGRPGVRWQPGFPPPTALEEARTARLVLITGELDFNRDQTRGVYQALQEDGFIRTTLFEIPEAEHGFGVRGEWLARVIDSLDSATGSEP